MFSVDEYGVIVENSEVIFREDSPVDAYLLLGSEVDHEKIRLINSKFIDVFVTQDHDVSSVFKISFLPRKDEVENVHNGFKISDKRNLNIFYENRIILNNNDCFIMAVVDQNRYVLAYSMFSLEVGLVEYQECLKKYVDFYLEKSTDYN
ncbi:MAG: hypothetical protein RIB30_08760 [Thalassospira sp.]|uniref:hypothetical protein n=1 Tax=Thalassospira sp. TaxID=1912094 RepID=UPI0032ED31C2